MSGVKTYSIRAGAAVAPTNSRSGNAIGSSILGAALATLTSAGAAITATGAVITDAVETIAQLGSQAVNAYQERVRREQEAARQREQEVQKRVADLRARVRANASKSQVTVKLPPTTTTSSPTKVVAPSRPTVQAEDRDAQRKIQDLQSRLPNIESEYQALVNQGLLDDQTANQALQKTRQALNDGNWATANAHLQALDDARMQTIQQLRSQWEVQINYVQERLDGLSDSLPATVTDNLNQAIALARTNWQSLSDQDLQALHQQISDLHDQADRIREAADNLVASWVQVGYVAQFLGIDNGDVVIEVETHEGANTQMRIQFDGQEMGLVGPHDPEPLSCAERTQAAMQIFQEQGYYLEWTHQDNQPVPEEWRQIGTPASEEEGSQASSAQTARQSKSRRRVEGQGY